MMLVQSKMLSIKPIVSTEASQPVQQEAPCQQDAKASPPATAPDEAVAPGLPEDARPYPQRETTPTATATKYSPRAKDKCIHIKKLRLAHNHCVFNPQKWLCKVCGTTESVWACLSCTNVACGRYNEEHALKHFKESKHPLAIEVNDRYVFCYDCDDYILNDNAPGDLKLLRTTLDAITKQTLYESQTRSGRRLLRALSVDTGEQIKHRRQESLTWEDKGHTALVHRRLVLLSKIFLPWKSLVHGDKITGKKPKPTKLPPKRSLPKTAKNIPVECEKRSKKRTRPDELRIGEIKRKWTVLTPGVTGLRNLGNTCYMNSILQVLGHLHQFRECFLHLELNLPPRESSHSHVVGTRRQTEYMRQTTIECFEEVQKPKGGAKSKGRILRQPGPSSGGLSGGSDEAVDLSTYKDPRTVRNNLNVMSLSACLRNEGTSKPLSILVWEGRS
ncbi:ubiquitin carboxyl-terminal hydrolase 44-B-like [Asterias rubens]|uniref:ubiquitin carboxyl-terminal hydrolase 44-B-like n=1 Tax=Asterias rubens TaxID=7604 RepID=UPI0014554174|nr:ubiquitin carboxyl-terminal hydrolase 44-B-like [Asterias rubens]